VRPNNESLLRLSVGGVLRWRPQLSGEDEVFLACRHSHGPGRYHLLTQDVVWVEQETTHNSNALTVCMLTVFLTRFGTFLRSELKFPKLPVQSPHHCVTCAHQKKHFLISSNKLQMLWYIHANDHLQFSALSYIINCLCHVDQNAL
jgi:hypothetical protein